MTHLESILGKYSQVFIGTIAGLHCGGERLVPGMAWSGVESRILKGEDQFGGVVVPGSTVSGDLGRVS